MRNLSRSQAQLNQLGRLLHTAAGRMRVAAALGPSLRRRRDYMSIARKALMVETLPDGALPIYDKEFDETGRSFVEAFIVGEEGGDIVRVVKPKRVTVPTFEITAAPLIPISQIKERRFDIVERSLNLSKAEMGATEDGHVFGLFDGIATAGAGKAVDDPVYNPDMAPAAGPVSVDMMADAYGQVERHDISVALVFMNPRNYTDLRKWTDSTVDRETERKLLKTGIMGYVWGATILQSRKVTRNQFYVLGDAEFLGVIPERIPLTVMSADQPLLRAIGFSIFENLGFLIFNPSAIQRVIVS
jgi:hypothetical protein